MVAAVVAGGTARRTTAGIRTNKNAQTQANAQTTSNPTFLNLSFPVLCAPAVDSRIFTWRAAVQAATNIQKLPPRTGGAWRVHARDATHNHGTWRRQARPNTGPCRVRRVWRAGRSQRHVLPSRLRVEAGARPPSLVEGRRADTDGALSYVQGGASEPRPPAPTTHAFFFGTDRGW
jgi:hypothetical protein